MTIFEVEDLWDELSEIEAYLGVLTSLDEHVNSEYIALLTCYYYDKLTEIRAGLRKKIEQNSHSE